MIKFMISSMFELVEKDLKTSSPWIVFKKSCVRAQSNSRARFKLITINYTMENKGHLIKKRLRDSLLGNF
jgi:hypothetical protein